MNAEILSVGTELLLGHTVNTNAAYLSRQLAGTGIDCFYHTSVGDNPARLAALLRLALERSDIVLMTGGLGPTVDDITCATAAEALGVPLVYDAAVARQIRSRWQRRGYHPLKQTLRQAWVPRGAHVVPNRHGTAPGWILPAGGRLVIAMPGVPIEMRTMMTDTILPCLRRHAPGLGVLVTRTLNLANIPESRVDLRVKRWLRLKPPVTVGIYAGLSQVELRITAKAASAPQARRLIAPVERQLRRRIGEYCFGVDEETLEAAVGRALLRRRWRIALAESCTGGAITDRLTNVPGSSRYVIGSVVAYHNVIKTLLLDVGPALLRRHGAVSVPVVAAMARAIRRHFHTHVGVAVTGIAGPTGGTRTKPVGLVFISVVTPRAQRTVRHLFLGEREAIKYQAGQACLDLVRRLTA